MSGPPPLPRPRPGPPDLVPARVPVGVGRPRLRPAFAARTAHDPQVTDMPRPWFVFDVESIGLHGEAFAVAWVVLDQHGNEAEARVESCPPGEATGTDTARRWVSDHCTPLTPTRYSPQQVRQAFWEAWSRWKQQDSLLIADCGWPVEARFLAACVDDARPAVRKGRTVPDGPRDFQGPYPLHELASVLLGAGLDPRNRPPRLPDELPEHHPLMDVRFTVRQLRQALAGGGR